jgi:hypothetical protein
MKGPVLSLLHQDGSNLTGDVGIFEKTRMRRLISQVPESSTEWEYTVHQKCPEMRPMYSSSLGRKKGKMPTRERLLYASENGDRWSLRRNPESGSVVVRHRANLSSGGLVSDFGLGEFLVQGGLGPEKQELLRLIGSLIDSEAKDDAEPGPS